VSALLATGCAASRPPGEPSIVFSKVPPFGEGSSTKVDPIEGRVGGTRGGEKIVLYARSGIWWVQPWTRAPFTAVDADSGWRGSTHPGSAYAALLVKPGYSPSLKVDTLPGTGDGVLAVAVAEAPQMPAASGRNLRFAGYQWKVRETPFEPGGTRNDYDPANAWTDRDGSLHLKIAGAQGHWKSAEVRLSRSLGYGTYRFVLRGLSQLEPAAMFTIETWDNDGPSREMDVDLGRWGETTGKNGQFVIQPYLVPANTVQFDLPDGAVTIMLRWTQGVAAFRAFRGAVTRWESMPVREHIFSSGVPSTGNEAIHMNLYLYGARNPPRRENEVTVEAFEFLP
jgi:hypothetical protein